MLAARLNETEAALTLEDVPEPEVSPGTVRVKVLASHVLAMTSGVISGQMPFDLPTPYTLGTSAIGTVDVTGEGVYWLEKGQVVFCDPLIYSEANDSPYDLTLLGWFGLSESSKEIQGRFRDGAFAEKVVYPAENLTVMDAATEGREPSALAILNFLNVSYGAALRGELRPGQNVAITGATGNLGASSVAVALAMGASKVAAVGRTEGALEELRGLDPARVVPVSYEDPDEIGERVREALGEADLVLDALGAVETPDVTMGAVSAPKTPGHGGLVRWGLCATAHRLPDDAGPGAYRERFVHGPKDRTARSRAHDWSRNARGGCFSAPRFQVRPGKRGDFRS